MSKVNMGSGSLDKNAATSPAPVPVCIISERDEGYEDSLVDLWRVLAKRKTIVLVSFLLAMLLAFTYLFFSKPVYKASAYLSPSQQQQIQGLLVNYRGITGANINQYTTESVFGIFLDNLKSPGIRREFFDDHKLIKHYDTGESEKGLNADYIFDKLFNDQLKVQVAKQSTSFVMVSFSYMEPTLVAQWLNQFIDFVNARTVQQLYSDVNSAIQSDIGQVRYQLDSKLKYAKYRKRDKITSLKEALSIAGTLGIKNIGAYPKMTGTMQTGPGLAVNTAEVPLYMRGVDALRTEIAVLESRKSDEPFISGYRDLQERLTLLESMSIDASGLSAVTVSAVAKAPYRAEKPRKLVVILIAAVLGFMAGIFLVFVAEFRLKVFGGRKNLDA